MYLDAHVRVPEIRGKITYRTKGDTTYVEYESDRVYHPEKKYTTVTLISWRIPTKWDFQLKDR